MQDVNHPRNACVLSERNDALFVHLHPLIVNQTNALSEKSKELHVKSIKTMVFLETSKTFNMTHLLQDGVEQSHVGFLCLDGVREEGIGLVRLKQVDRDLFHPKDQGRFGNILLDLSSDRRVSLQSKRQRGCSRAGSSAKSTTPSGAHKGKNNWMNPQHAWSLSLSVRMTNEVPK